MISLKDYSFLINQASQESIFHVKNLIVKITLTWNYIFSGYFDIPTQGYLKSV